MYSTEIGKRKAVEVIKKYLFEGMLTKLKCLSWQRRLSQRTSYHLQNTLPLVVILAQLSEGSMLKSVGLFPQMCQHL